MSDKPSTATAKGLSKREITEELRKATAVRLLYGADDEAVKAVANMLMNEDFRIELVDMTNSNIVERESMQLQVLSRRTRRFR
mmetsp:Transcript_19107/g.38475  ORF Transcript_19107/g.38475 Transcript_19107/m.38475 type:complete len:83 (+) Transcript_19107:89-337(+)